MNQFFIVALMFSALMLFGCDEGNKHTAQQTNLLLYADEHVYGLTVYWYNASNVFEEINDGSEIPYRNMSVGVDHLDLFKVENNSSKDAVLVVTGHTIIPSSTCQASKPVYFSDTATTLSGKTITIPAGGEYLFFDKIRNNSAVISTAGFFMFKEEYYGRGACTPADNNAKSCASVDIGYLVNIR